MLRFKLIDVLGTVAFFLFPLPLIANPLPQPSSPISQPMSVNSSEAIARRGPTLECCNCLNETKTVSLNTGVVNWTVIWPETTVPRATEMVTNSAWTTTAIPAARWISPTDFPQSPSNYGVHIYETKVDLRNCTIGSSVTISGRLEAAREIRTGAIGGWTAFSRHRMLRSGDRHGTTSETQSWCGV
jgi:hypothetical protein